MATLEDASNTEEGFDRILYEEKSEEGWTLSSRTDMVEVWTKSEPDTPVHLIKGFLYLPGIPPKHVVELLINLELRKKWDRWVHDINVIEEHPTHRVVYWRLKMPLFADCDFVENIFMRSEESTGMTTILYKNATHPACPERKGVVRAETIFAGTIVRPYHQDPNSTQMSMLFQNDIKGWIPYYVANLFARRAPVKWRDEIFNFYQNTYRKELAKQQIQEEGTDEEQHIQVYQRALEKRAKIPLKYLKVLFFGPPRTGKTSMRRRLVGEIVNLKGEPKQRSTGTAEGYDVLLKRAEEPDATVKLSEEKTTLSTNVITEPTKWLSVNKIGGKKAHETDLNEEIQLLCKFVYKENMSGVKTSPKHSSPLKDSETEDKQPLEDNGIFKKERASKSSDPPSKNMSYVKESRDKAADKAAKDHSKTEEDTVPASTPVEPSKTTEINPSTSSPHKTSVAEQMEEIRKEFQLDTEQMKEIKQAIEDFYNALHASEQDNFNILVLMNMVDTGGQPAFVEMLPALTIGSALYLIFFRLDQELKKTYSIRYLDKNDQEIELGHSSYTVEEVISQALSSIACFSSTALNMPNSENMQYQSCVGAVLMGTYKDELKHNPNAEIETKARALQGVTSIFNLDEKILYPAETETNQLIFAIDNMEGDDKELEKVRKRLEEIIEDKFVSKPIPVSWLMFGILLRKMGKPTMLLSQCHAIGKLASVPDKELNTALWFLHHHVGIVMHFPEAGIEDIVICNPQVVFDSVTDLISKSFTHEKVLYMKSQWHTFRDAGQFKLNDLQNLEVTSLPRAELVKLLEYLKIIAPIKSDKSSKQLEELIYFMPAVLEHAKDGELHMEQRARDPVPLMIRFKCGFVPVGVFCAMIASLVAQEDTWKLQRREGHSMYKNKVTFRVDSTFDVTLISKVKRYEIHIARISTIDSQLEEMCRDTLETVCDTLDKVMKFKPDCSTPNKSLYELGFKCPEHPDDDHLVINRPTDLEKNSGEEVLLSAKSLWFKGKPTIICLEEDKSIDFSETRSYVPQSLVWFGKATKISSALPASLPDKATEKATELFATQVVLILHTCIPKEFWAALDKLEPPTKEDNSKIQNCPIIYPHGESVIGWFGGYRAAVVRTRQGSGCCDDLTKALTESFPNGQVIIAAGIAYTNDQRRKFADVLISDEVENFVQYKMAGNEITNHGPREKIDPNLQSVFVDPARDWKHADDNQTSVHIGCIVSAPKLVKDEMLRDQLMKHTPDAIGGEMIGWILLQLKNTLKKNHEHMKDIKVIVIKGVADYGDLKMGDKWEWTAAEAAVDYIHYCLKKSGGTEFSASEIAKRVSQEAKETQSLTTGANSGKPSYEEVCLKLDEKNVVNVLHESKFADGDWENLGQQLIEHHALRTIRADHPGQSSLCMSCTISHWLNNDLEASWEKLANAVVKVERYGEATAHIVRQKAGISVAETSEKKRVFSHSQPISTADTHITPEAESLHPQPSTLACNTVDIVDLESESSSLTSTPKRKHPAAKESPAEKPLLELSRNRMLQCGVITGVLVVLLSIVIWWSLAMRNASYLPWELQLKFDGRPTLPTLRDFPGRDRSIDIVAEIGTDYSKLGTLLLDDNNGKKVSNIEKSKLNDPVDIAVAILKAWIEGKGRTPVTWQTLVTCLRKTDLNVLADDIQTVLSEHKDSDHEDL